MSLVAVPAPHGARGSARRLSLSLLAASIAACAAPPAPPPTVAGAFGVAPIPVDASIGRVTAEDLDREGFTKATRVVAPNGGAIWIVAQPGVPDIAVARARNLLSFFLTPVDGAEFGGTLDKANVANRMADRGAMLMMPEGAHEEGEEPDLPAQPLYEDETPIDGARWYLDVDWNHRDAAFEEIFHLVHDEGIGTYEPGALPQYQDRLDREARAAIADGRWGRPIEPGVRAWLEELEDEGSLAQEYIASVIDTYYGLWAPFDERPGGMWGIYCAGTRSELDELDPAGRALVEAFLPPTLVGYEALIDPSFVGQFTLRYDPDRPWTHRSRYLVQATLTGDRDSDLEGNEHDNVLAGNAGSNRIDGGAGVDTVRFRGVRAEYALARDGATLVVADSDEGRDGTDRLASIERIEFADAVVEASSIE